jgi:hypothetical protein
MSNVNDINRPSAKQPKVRNLNPSGMPKARTRRLSTTGRDPRTRRGR